MPLKSRPRQLLAGLATLAACLGAAALLVAVHQQHEGTDDDHAPTTFSAAGDWTVSPTARNLLGTGCSCNVQIVGGFNGSKGEKGETGEFRPGTALPNATIANGTISGTIVGGATYADITLARSSVTTSLDFKETSDRASPRFVKIGAPADVTANYTIRLPDAYGSTNSFLQVSTSAPGVSTTAWSNTLVSTDIQSPSITTPTITGGSASGTILFNANLAATTARQFRARDAILATSVEPLVCTGRNTNNKLSVLAGCTLSPAHTGAIIQWSDGTSSRITSRTGAGTADIEEFEGPRDRGVDIKFNLFRADQSFSASHAHTTIHAPTIYDVTGTSGAQVTKSVKLSLAPMTADATATWQFPPIAEAGTDTLVGASATQTLTNKRLSGATLDGITSTTGPAPVIGLYMISSACTGDLDNTQLSASSCKFSMRSIGDTIVWANGDVSLISDVGSLDGNGDTYSAVVVMLSGSGTPARLASAFTLRTSGHGGVATPAFSIGASAIGGRLVMRGGLPSGYGSAAVTIDMYRMDTRSQRLHAKWTFPYPAPENGGWNRFVGENTEQTLTRKTLAGATLNGATNIDAGATIASPTVVGSIAVKATAGATTATTISPTGITFPPVMPPVDWQNAGTTMKLDYFKAAHFALTGARKDKPDGTCAYGYVVQIGRVVTATFTSAGDGVFAKQGTNWELSGFPIEFTTLNQMVFPFMLYNNGVYRSGLLAINGDGRVIIELMTMEGGLVTRTGAPSDGHVSLAPCGISWVLI